MEAQRKKHLEATNRNSKAFDCRVESFVQEDKLTMLVRENALKRSAGRRSTVQHQWERRLVSAEKTISKLRSQLEKANQDLVMHSWPESAAAEGS